MVCEGGIFRACRGCYLRGSGMYEHSSLWASWLSTGDGAKWSDYGGREGRRVNINFGSSNHNVPICRVL